ncbi:transcriptional regulator, GntR family [Enhydrobacter aerosaccus]|uniref:Transcriptional regulator, GntR family n=1 Tax=Enhydrobacter aerosaccus TaxID=225324 RepID=A0A1T4P0K0_9HYPH|nr:phosphonate metabolism transcriptional regulator PhnF [Enhydrobacter aerosaccus]SJZ85084.1 transcriptional regulator, GntR family [Enhydrobacter aerosaccus]
MPIYRQIADVLEAEILESRDIGKPWSELALSSRFGVNRHTLRRAVDVLVSGGLVRRQRGVGIHVLPGAIDYKLSPATRFTMMIEDSGHSADTRILRKTVTCATDDIAQQLGLEAGDQMIAIEAVRSVDEQPFCVQSQFLPYAIVPYVAADYNEGSLHGFLADRGGIKLGRLGSMISTMLPDEGDAQLLRIDPSQPVLQVRSLNMDTATGRPVEYCVTRFRGDRLELRVQFPG